VGPRRRLGGILAVTDQSQRLTFAFDDLLAYAGPHSPGGVAHAYKVLELTLPLLAGGEPPERREIRVRTAFGGPGARDGFELVTRAVTGGRYEVDPGLARPELGEASARFVFELSHRGERMTASVRQGFVTDEFAALAGAARRSEAQEGRLTLLKREMCERVMAVPAREVYAVI
jgi:hypothetical protein